LELGSKNALRGSRQWLDEFLFATVAWMSVSARVSGLLGGVWSIQLGITMTTPLDQIKYAMRPRDDRMGFNVVCINMTDASTTLEFLDPGFHLELVQDGILQKTRGVPFAPLTLGPVELAGYATVEASIYLGGTFCDLHGVCDITYNIRRGNSGEEFLFDKCQGSVELDLPSLEELRRRRSVNRPVSTPAVKIQWPLR
jgi:hypothetical protein